MQAEQFSAAPAAVQRQKYRDDDSPKQSTNIMHDRRVVRGSTYSALVLPNDNTDAKVRAAQRQRLIKANYSQTRRRAGTPEPVPGRHHMDVQTDTYLEELTDRQTEFEAEVQTDFLLDRPSTPLFMPAKSDEERATQIEEGELFDFDTEVEPILEVLVGKTLERSMMEVLEEEELSGMRRHQEYFQQLREQELVEVQRMEAAEQRRQEEIFRRKEQESARRQLDDAVMRKILSRSLSRNYLSGLQKRCFEELHDAGIFKDNYLVAIEGSFMPSLVENVKNSLKDLSTVQAALDLCIKKTLTDKSAVHAGVLAEAAKKAEEIEAAEIRAQTEKNESMKLARMEAIRIREEQKLMRAGEDFDWITGRVCVDFNAEEKVLTLDDESTDVVVPSEEMVSELVARVQANAEAEGEVDPIEVVVNMTKRTVLEIKPAPEKPVVEEEAEAEEAAEE